MHCYRQYLLHPDWSRNFADGNIIFQDNSFGYDDFERIRFLMPWIVEFSFDELGNCVDIKRHSV